MYYISILDYHSLMLSVGRDDLRNRISPRLRDFYTNQPGTDEPEEGVVNWYKAYMSKAHCEETNGYVCQRPAVSNRDFADERTGNLFTYLVNTLM